MGEEVEGQEQSGQEEVGSVAPETGGGDNLNPAWNDLLEVVPTMLHSQVTPHLQQWDKNYQEGINKVHSQYEAYKPYLENNIAPDQINYALQLAKAIDERPQDVIKALQEYTGASQQQAEQIVAGQQGQVDETESPEWLNHPQFQRMQQMMDTMAQIMVQQNQTAQMTQEDQALANELDSLHQKHGDFDERWVLTNAAMDPNTPLEKHVEAYKEFVSGIIKQQRQPGPKVMGAGGVAPDNQVDVSKLDGKGRRALIAQSLAAAAQQNG